MTKQMQFEYFDLPAHWAAYFINVDPTGYSGDEIAMIETWIDDQLGGYPMTYCIGVSCADTAEECDPWFTAYHDARYLNVGACDVARFTFHVGYRDD